MYINEKNAYSLALNITKKNPDWIGILLHISVVLFSKIINNS